MKYHVSVRGIWVRLQREAWDGWSVTWAPQLFSERYGYRRPIWSMGRVRVFTLKGA